MLWKNMMIAASCCTLILSQLGCETMNGSMSRAQRGALIGAASGAAAGALIGSKKDDALKGAIIGGVLGGAAGGVIGSYMDKQAKELRRVAEVVRVDDGIIVTMRDRILFDVGKANLNPGSQASLQKLAEILNKYEKTEVTVAGHTDNTGSAIYNQQLSKRRANGVRLSLTQRGVVPSRLSAMGFGFDRPIAPNATSKGRSLNRRVELHISPDKRLLKDAQKAQS